MKKLILATAMAGLTASTATSAATLYEKDDLTLEVQGDYQIQLYQPVGDDQDLDVDYDDLELKFGAKYNLNNGMTAFGQLDLDWKNQGDGSDDEIVNNAYVGLGIGSFTTSLGRQTWGSDDFGIEKAIEMNGGTAFSETSGNDTVKFAYDAARFGAVLSHDLEVGDTDESVTDLLLTTKFGPAKIGVAYQDYKADAATAAVDTTGIMASFGVGRANVGLDYSTNDNGDFINAAAGFSVGKTEAAIGVTQEKPDGADDILHWYANGTRQLHKNVSVFAEIGDNDVDNTDLGYLAGMRVKF